MKIAMILKKSLRESMFSDKSMIRLRALGEVTLNESNDTGSIENVLRGADIAITSWGSGYYTENLLLSAPNLRLAAHAGGSVKPIVTDALWANGIRVTAAPKPLGQGVGETALGLTIASTKNIFNLSRNIRSGGWSEGSENIVDLYDITIGVIGAGWAGKHYISLLHNFNVNILLYDPFVDEAQAEALHVRKTELDELLRVSDIVSIHAPSVPETNHMFNARTLSLMKKDAVLINTARGSIIDEQALYEHMRAGNLKYACLDVTEPEPPSADHPLRGLSNVIFTPHLAGLSNNGQKRIGAFICDEIDKFLNGKTMECEVTKEMLATMA